MGISKENLGVAIEEIKLSSDESYSSKDELSVLSGKVDSISIAQKTVNTKGIRELMTSEEIMEVSPATQTGTSVRTTINKDITLSESIENFDIIKFHAAIKSVDRFYQSLSAEISVDKIIYNPNDSSSSSDGSVIIIPIDLSSTNSLLGGMVHCCIIGWFKTPNIFRISHVDNPNADGATAHFSTIVLKSIKGVKIENITIDPVEYVNTNQGIEDTPVGHILSLMGKTAPKHYLVCDGAIFNIADYPYLSQYIKDQFGAFNIFGGDGINTFAVPARYEESLDEDLTDVTPTMTSNTTPSPYKVTQSSYLATGGLDRSGWNAFDKGNVFNPSIPNYWSTNNTPTGWVTFDFSTKTSVTHFSITTRTKYFSRDSSYASDSPKNFNVYGSDDDINYELIINVTDQVNWVWNTERIFNFGKKVSYRYYKLEILSNNGAAHTSITELKYLLNKNTQIRCIKYEPTYFMNIQGMIEETVLWEGNIGSNKPNVSAMASIDLSDSIENYDKISVHYHAQILNGGVWFLYGEFTPYDFNLVKNNPQYTTLSFVFGWSDGKNYTNIKQSSTPTRLDLEQYESYVTKIVGIKYRTFT